MSLSLPPFNPLHLTGIEQKQAGSMKKGGPKEEDDEAEEAAKVFKKSLCESNSCDVFLWPGTEDAMEQASAIVAASTDRFPPIVLYETIFVEGKKWEETILWAATQKELRFFFPSAHGFLLFLSDFLTEESSAGINGLAPRIHSGRLFPRLQVH